MSAALISRTVLMLVIATIVAGCATKKDFYATGGSRADGTVDMAYDFRPYEAPVVNQQQAKSIAKSKCSVWGYGDAEPFGGITQNCYQRNGFGTCVSGQNIIKYQCIGNLDAPPSVSAVQAGGVPVKSGMSKDMQVQQLKQSLIENRISYDEYRTRYQILTGQ